MNFNAILSALFGNKSSRDIKKIQPLVDKVKAAYPAIEALSNDELRAKSKEIQQYVQGTVSELKQQIADLKDKIEQTPIDEREPIFNHIDKLEQEVLDRLEVALDEVYPVAFSIVKETARRFAENEETIVTATDFDRELASDPAKDFITIDGDKAIYHNHWTAGGNDLKWEMIHYDVQLFGGTVLHQGKIAEMATGEGKTLVATCPVFLNALTGNGVHVVTVNDYLAKRDSEWMGPLYMFHGLSVDCIDKHRPNSEARRKAYRADITFGTNNEFGFDYLRDNMAMQPEDLVQRKHNYAIVDEVDSVLIDDARTPLIISGPVPKGDDQMFEEYQPLVEKIVAEQRKLATQLLAEAKQKITRGNEEGNRELTEEGFLALFRSYKALPKNTPLVKFLSEDGIKSGMLSTEEHYMENNNRRMPEAIAPLYFVVDEKMHGADLTDKGVEWLSKQVGDKELFVIPDITSQLSALEAETGLSDEERLEKKDALINHFSEQSERVHTLQQLLKAYSLYNRDDEYVVIDGQVKIVDEQTGRIMEGRRWSDGLHQAVEAKEHVKVEAATQTYATITLQNYFRMYHKLAGMTGTASTEAGEFWDIYKLDVVEIPTNRPVIRKDMDDRVYKTAREKYKAVVEEVIAMRDAGRPVLVGTTSVEISELLHNILKRNGVNAQVLNAKEHARESLIVAEAGKSINGKGVVTIATNMAGRGTDIKLTPEVKAAGGLAIIGTERHESRRVDRQLRGRAGRQGDPGSSVFYVSLEDKLMRLFGSERIAKVMDRLGFEEGERIEAPMISRSIERAQKKVEENNFGIRKRLLEYDDVMNKQRTVIYERRRHALMGERIGMDITNVIWDRVLSILSNNDYEGCKERFLKLFFMDVPFTENEFVQTPRQQLEEDTFQKVMANFKLHVDKVQAEAQPVVKQIYEDPNANFERIIIPLTDMHLVYRMNFDLKECYDSESKNIMKEFEKMILLHTIDDNWKENLRQLDELRHSSQNASYEQKDPLLIFKLESVKLWDAMINQMNDSVCSTLSRIHIHKEEAPAQAPVSMPKPEPQPQYQTNKPELNADGSPALPPMPGQMPQGMRDGMNRPGYIDPTAPQMPPRIPIVKGKEPRPNDPCPCGSGKKYKHCHGKK
ncbi:MAG: preprotein translocase subunit SecA [Prevotella sp.]|nr:preprotein translocase subunit SecA [Prevotella sp.]